MKKQKCTGHAGSVKETALLSHEDCRQSWGGGGRVMGSDLHF